MARAARKGEVDHFNYMLRNACDKALSTSYNLDDRWQWDAQTFKDAWQFIPDDRRYKRFAKSYFDNHWLNPKNSVCEDNDDIIARLDELTQY